LGNQTASENSRAVLIFAALSKEGLPVAEIKEVYSAAHIADRVQNLAAEIAHAYEGRDLTILSAPEESFVFLADLLRGLHAPVRTAFLRSKHNSLAGVQDISFTTDTDLTRCDVLLIESVLETGVPQEYLIKQLLARGAASVRLCVLLDKPDSRRVELKPDWRAFETGEEFLFGYGLGFHGRFCELPFLATFAEKQRSEVRG